MMSHLLEQRSNLGKLAALRNFLRHKVYPELVITSQKQAHKAMSKQSGKPLTVNDLEVFSLLPQSLQRSIHVELCSKHLQHPLLRWWFLIDRKGAQDMCFNAIQFLGLAPEDHLFFPRADAEGAYILTSGQALYTHERSGQSR